MKKIEKININLFPESTSEEEYKRERAGFIAEAESYRPGGFLTSGHLEKDPAKGEAKWNSIYPGGYKEWKGKQRYLNAYGEQDLINKINEIIDLLNDNKTKKKNPIKVAKIK